MSEALSNVAVTAVIEGDKGVDRQARIAELEKKLAKAKGDIVEQERLEKRWLLFEGACKKLRQEMGKTLTREEYDAIDGIYIFLHSGCVDFVRHIPSATDRGESKRLEKDLELGEAMKGLSSLTK